MKQKIFLSGLIVFFIIVSSLNLFSEEIISPEKSKVIIEQLRAYYVPYYSKYRGIEYLRRELIKEFNPSDDKLLSTSNLLISRREYFYEEPEYTVIKYEKDGKEMKPADYKGSKSLPLYPVFDEKGIERYDTSVEGYETIEGKRCYRIKVTPKEATERHYMGYYYYDTKDFALIKLNFTLGKLPFAVKEFSFKGIFNIKDELNVLREFTMTMRLKIPILFDRRIITTCKTTEAKAIMR